MHRIRSKNQNLDANERVGFVKMQKNHWPLEVGYYFINADSFLDDAGLVAMTGQGDVSCMGSAQQFSRESSFPPSPPPFLLCRQATFDRIWASSA